MTSRLYTIHLSVLLKCSHTTMSVCRWYYCEYKPITILIYIIATAWIEQISLCIKFCSNTIVTSALFSCRPQNKANEDQA